MLDIFELVVEALDCLLQRCFCGYLNYGAGLELRSCRRLVLSDDEIDMSRRARMLCFYTLRFPHNNSFFYRIRRSRRKACFTILLGLAPS